MITWIGEPEKGILAHRTFEDGRSIDLLPLTFGRVRISLTLAGPMHRDCYESNW